MSIELPTSDFLRYLAPVLILLGLYDVPNTWHLRAFRAASDLAGTPLIATANVRYHPASEAVTYWSRDANFESIEALCRQARTIRPYLNVHQVMKNFICIYDTFRSYARLLLIQDITT